VHNTLFGFIIFSLDALYGNFGYQFYTRLYIPLAIPENNVSICEHNNHHNKTWVLFRPVDREVFVRDLNRQLGTPSHWLPMDSCKKEDKEAP